MTDICLVCTLQISDKKKIAEEISTSRQPPDSADVTSNSTDDLLAGVVNRFRTASNRKLPDLPVYL